LAALVSKEVAEVRKQKFTRGVFPLLLLGVILLFVFGCKGSDSSSVRIGFVGSNFSNHMDYEFSTFTGTESNKFKAQQGDLIKPTYDVTLTKGKITIELISPTKELVWKKDIQQNEQGMTELVLEESGWYTFLVTGQAAGGSFYLSWDVITNAEK